jgi:hypothetical protein
MSTKSYAYKHLPTFNPTYYRAWASDVEAAFAERNWSSYLVPPSVEPSTSTSTGKETESIDFTIHAHAFLNQSIPYEHKSSIDQCTTAAQIWLSFKQRYASQSREDELRLEGQLLDFKKQSIDTLDQHIAKFDNLISAIMAQQPQDQRYDDTKINRYFLRTLETANIPNEDWKGFITFTGKTWLSITKDQLFAEARTYYNTHIQSQQSVHDTDQYFKEAPKALTVRASYNATYPSKQTFYARNPFTIWTTMSF